MRLESKNRDNNRIMESLRRDTTNVEYEDRIVAIIDILGFRAMVGDTVEKNIVNHTNLERLIVVLRLIKEEFKNISETGELPPSFMITFFSDSIVLSLSQFNTVALLSIFEVLKRIQIKLIDFEVLLRGGV